MDFPGGSDSNESAWNAETRAQSLGGEDSLEEGMATHSQCSCLETYGQRSLVGYCPLGHKELNMTELLTIN